MKTVLSLLMLPLIACSSGPITSERTVTKEGTITTKRTWAGGSFLTKSQSVTSMIDPKTGKIRYTTKKMTETTVGTQALTSDILKNTLVPIAAP